LWPAQAQEKLSGAHREPERYCQKGQRIIEQSARSTDRATQLTQTGFAEYGAPDGTPVLFIHGSPDSRHIHADTANVAERLDVKLIAVDRPGYKN
jgi:hypothetical protein